LSVATAAGSIVALPIAGSARSAPAQASAPSILTCSEPRSSWPHSTLACYCETYNSRPDTQTRTTTIYDRRRENFDRHAVYVVVAVVAGA
jgi:hypothetical protein